MSDRAVNTPFYHVGEWYIASGITGRVGENLVPGGFAQEFACILRRLGEMLAERNLPRSSIAKVSIFLVDMRNRARLNEMYLEFFGAHLPARTVVGVSEISRGAQVELEAWAYSRE